MSFIQIQRKKREEESKHEKEHKAYVLTKIHL